MNIPWGQHSVDERGSSELAITPKNMAGLTQELKEKIRTGRDLMDKGREGLNI